MGVASLDAAMTDQLLREWPPGYGGVERVAHELAVVWGGTVWSLDAQGLSGQDHDALPVPYPRRRLPCTPPVARLRLPWPSRALWQLLNSKQPLHGHLPSPGVLAVLLLARLFNRRRRVTAHWHCFVESGDGWTGRLHALYQHVALQTVPWLSGVVTTSPVLRDALISSGCVPQRVMVLPCCLSQEQEAVGLAIPRQSVPEGSPFKVLFIGRLDSYKRLDWLIEALAGVRGPWQLLVVGDGPRRAAFELLCQQRIGARSGEQVSFLGRLSEEAKQACLATADVLVLPSDRSTEAFGIVQLEAMAAGIPALAFQRQRSGMGWVGQLPGLTWSQQPEDLREVLQALADQPAWRVQLGQQARLRYRQLFARAVWLSTLQGLFQPTR